MNIEYPTEWEGGKNVGEISERDTHYIVRISPPGTKPINKFFNFNKYGGKDIALVKAEAFRKKTLDDNNLTINQYRYIDEDTIQVKLIGGKIMITDAKYLPIINKYNMRTKKSKKNGDKFYVDCGNNKKGFTFAKRISGFKQAKYINGNSLDVRLCNLKGNKRENNDSQDDETESSEEIMSGIDMHFENILKNIDNAKHYQTEYGKGAEDLMFYKLFQYEKAKNIVEGKHGKMISTPIEYMDAHTKLLFECPKKHLCSVTLSNLNLGKWCAQCNLHIGELISKCAIEFLLQEQFTKIRPDWLKNEDGNNLEIDAYSAKLKLGLEYQGVQHQQYVYHFHRTREEFEKRKKHDELKKKLCEENDVTLIEVIYTTKENDICRNIYDKLIKLGFQIPEDRVAEFNINDIYKVDTKTEELRKIIEGRGGKLMEGEYLFLDSIITFMCDKGHLYTTKARYIVYGSWCATCGYVVDDDRKEKISLKLIERFKTEEGKKEKQLSHAKRSETMKERREEIRANITEKKCSKPDCTLTGQFQPVTNFCKKAGSADGYQSWCKTCTNLNKKKIRLV